jgi:hypothetical protein
MTLLTQATDVFAAAEKSGGCLVAFTAKRQPPNIKATILRRRPKS